MSGSANYPEQDLRGLSSKQRARVDARRHMVEDHGWDSLTLDRFDWAGPAQDVVELHEQTSHGPTTGHSHVG